MRIIIALAAAALALAGCSSQSATAPTDESPRGTNTPAASSAEPTETASSAAPEEDDGTARFGQTYTYENGLAVTVGKPKAFKPSQGAAGAESGDPAVKFTVRLVNNTGKKYDPVLFTATVQSGNTEGSQVYDSGKGIEGTPSTSLLNGREVEFPMVFAVADPKDIVMDVSPGFDYEAVIFAS